MHQGVRGSYVRINRLRPSAGSYGVYNEPVITGERAAEVRGLLARMRSWASVRPDVIAVGLAGSWSHGDARMDFDVDILLLTTEKRLYLEDESWVRELGGRQIVKTERWGPLTERRFVLSSGLEVEVGVASPSWAATDPVDPGTREVVEDGISTVYDPEGDLARLLDICR